MAIIKLTENNGAIRIFTDGFAPDPVPLPPPAPPPPPSNVIKGAYFGGWPAAQIGPIAVQFGLSYVRVWHTVSDWSIPPGPDHPTFLYCKQLRAQGLFTFVTFTPNEATPIKPAYPSVPSSPNTVSSYFAHAVQAAGGSVDAWQVINEVNLSLYNPDHGRSGTVVANILKPAYDVLKGQGQFVVSAGWSGTPGTAFLAWRDKGLLDTCDVVDQHPYGFNAAVQTAIVTEMHNLIGNKPLWMGEWGMHNITTTGGPAELLKAANAIKPYVSAVFLPRMIVSTAYPAGSFAPFDTNLQRRVPWYDAAVNALKVF